MEPSNVKVFYSDCYEKAAFKANMYFFVSFSGAGDEVVLKKSCDFDFDLEGFISKFQKPVMSNLLKSDIRIPNRSIHEAIEEYLIEYGYNRTFNKLAKTKKRPEEPWLVIKDSIKKSLTANDFLLAYRTINNNRQWVRDNHNLHRTICLLELMYLMRKKKPVKEILDFMSKKMAKFKAEVFELLDSNSKPVEVQMKVPPFDQEHNHRFDDE